MEGKTPKNFAIIGCAGYIAPRHLQAIKDTGNVLIAALDKSDSVGILDKYFGNVDFFTEFERFDRYVEKLHRINDGREIHYVTICSPNYLHDAHIHFAFRIGADAICEKPLVLNPWNLDALEELEKETGKKVYNIMQLRLHPSIIALKNKVVNDCSGEKYDVHMEYITTRGNWYFTSWKGDIEKSGGLVTNLGIHFFDMLLWIFGEVKNYGVYYSDNKKIQGYLEFEKANVNWFLSLDEKDLPQKIKQEGGSSYRSIKIDGDEIEFSDGFTDLHTKSYEEILAGRGFRIKDVRPSIDLVYKIRNTVPKNNPQSNNPVQNLKTNPEANKEYYVHESSVVDDDVMIGRGTKIWHFSHILPKSKIGKNCIIGQNILIGPEVVVGDNCKIQNNVSLFKGVRLEDDVFCGPSTVFTNVLTPRAFVDRKAEFKDTLVKKGATIGANATIICGNSIGKYSLIGAGSVITKDVPDYALFVGSPARHSGWVCKCGVVLSKNPYSTTEVRLSCDNCKNSYKHIEDKFFPIEES